MFKIAFLPLAVLFFFFTWFSEVGAFDTQEPNGSKTILPGVQKRETTADRGHFIHQAFQTTVNNLAITKSVSTNSVPLGGQVTFTIKIENQGPDDVATGPYLRLYDQLSKGANSMPLSVTLVSTPQSTCTPGSCLNNAQPNQLNSPLNLDANYQQFAYWKNNPAEQGFIAGGQTLTLTYTVEVNSTATCAAPTGHGFNNKAFFDLAGQPGGTITDSNPADNTTAPLFVEVTHNLSQCISLNKPKVGVSKTAKSGIKSYAWGEQVDYQILVTNFDTQPVEITGLYDHVYLQPVDPQFQVMPPFQVKGLTATCSYGPSTNPTPCPNHSTSLRTNTQQVYQLNPPVTVWSAPPWVSSFPILQPGEVLTLNISMKFYMNSCRTESAKYYFIHNAANVKFKYLHPGALEFGASPSFNTTMEEPPLCNFKVEKTFNGPPSGPIQFGTPYSYDITFTNHELNSPRTIYTLSDLMRINMQGYAQSLSFIYEYNCTANGVTTSNSLNSGSQPGTLVWSGTSFMQGSPIFQLGAGGVTFGPGAVLACTVDFQIEKPDPGQFCMQPSEAKLENGAFIAPIGNYNLNEGTPANPDNWDMVDTPLPGCFNLGVEKTAEGPGPNGEWIVGQEGDFILEVTNHGAPITSGEIVTITDVGIPVGFTIALNNLPPNWDNCNISNFPPSLSTSCQYIGPPVPTGQPFPPFFIEVTPQDIGEFVNCAEVEIVGVIDSDPSNNESCVSVMVDDLEEGDHDVSIEKTKVGTGIAGFWTAGETGVFILNVTNVGDSIETPEKVTVTDTLPAGFSINSVNGFPNWQCLSSIGIPGNLSCTYTGPQIASGQTFPPIQVTVNVTEVSGTYENCAALELDGATDLNMANNSGCVGVTVVEELNTPGGPTPSGLSGGTPSGPPGLPQEKTPGPAGNPSGATSSEPVENPGLPGRVERQLGKGRVAVNREWAALSAFPGNKVTRILTPKDKELMIGTTIEALNSVGESATTTWSNEQSGNSGTVVVGKFFEGKGGANGFCRSFTQTIALTNGTREEAEAKACQKANGSWRIVR